MKTPTIYDIKYATGNKQPYYFSHDSMKHFNQTLKDFHVRKSPTNRVFIYAEIGKTGIYTFREFVDNDLKNPDASMRKTLENIISFINTH